MDSSNLLNFLVENKYDDNFDTLSIAESNYDDNCSVMDNESCISYNDKDYINDYANNNFVKPFRYIRIKLPKNN